MNKKLLVENGKILISNGRALSSYLGEGTGEDTLKKLIDEVGCNRIFRNDENIVDISNIIDPEVTRDIINMDRMFYGCSNLQSIPQFNTSNVENMSYMFYCCTNLQSIPQLDTSKVTEMNRMFDSCTNLQSIPQLDTSKVTNMYNMFMYCRSLLEIPELDFSNVTNAGGLFSGCSSLKHIKNLNLKSITGTWELSDIFKECNSLETVGDVDLSGLTNWDWKDSLFGDITSLKSVGTVDLRNVQDNLRGIFKGCSSLTSIKGLIIGDVPYFQEIFRECSSLTEIPNLDTENIQDFTSVFYGCSSLVETPNINLKNATYLGYMFAECEKLSSIENIFNSIGDNSINMYEMFRNCNSLEHVVIPIIKPNFSMQFMFRYCENLKTLEIKDFKSSDINCTANWFGDCYSLKKVIFRNIRQDEWGQISKLSSDAFTGCYHFDGTQDDTYNPQGLKDGYIYVPRNIVDSLKEDSSWQRYKSIVSPIFGTKTFGEGAISEITNSNNETILSAVDDSGSLFEGWYTGNIIEVKIGESKKSISPTQEGFSYGFEKNSNGYYQNSNQGQGNSVAGARFTFNITTSGVKLRITFMQSSEQGCDYGIIGNIDEALPTYDYYDENCYMRLDEDNYEDPREIIFEDLSLGEHFIDIKYQKDGSVDSGTDSLQVKVELISARYKQEIDGELYSTEPEINIGIVDESTMAPVSYIAKFTDPNAGEIEPPVKEGELLTITQVSKVTRKEDTLEVE